MSEVSPTSTYRLPEGWPEPQRFEDVVDADGLRLYRVGLCSAHDGLEAVGSAADWRESPRARAEFELLERVSLLEASRNLAASLTTRARSGAPTGTRPCSEVFPLSGEPGAWTYARSNGVALHNEWGAACDHAALELVERDCVLRAWLGETKPRRITIDLRSSPLAKSRSYEWSVYLFPPPESGGLVPDAQTVGIFGFPCAPTAPFVFGYAARSSLDEAVRAATREAMQVMGFLWGEPLADRPPPPTPTPMCHLETFQCRERQLLVRRWLEGAHLPLRRGDAGDPGGVRADVCFVDLTPPWLEGGLQVARALSDSVLPLSFGLSPLTAHLPVELRIHPIP